jgi:hypothetical protein
VRLDRQPDLGLSLPPCMAAATGAAGQATSSTAAAAAALGSAAEQSGGAAAAEQSGGSTTAAAAGEQGGGSAHSGDPNHAHTSAEVDRLLAEALSMSARVGSADIFGNYTGDSDGDDNDVEVHAVPPHDHNAHPAVAVPGSGSAPRVKLDLFHAMRRIFKLLSKKHGAFRPFVARTGGIHLAQASRC